MDLCLIGKIVAVHGVAGGLRVQSYSDHPRRFTTLKKVLLGSSDDAVSERAVTRSIDRGKDVVLFLEGINTRNDAEQHVGENLFIPVNEMLPPPEGRVWVHELVGCAVVSTEGVPRGEIVDVFLRPAQDLYLVRFEGREVLLPAVPAIIVSVDTAAKRVTVNDVPGLFEDADED